MCYMHRIEPDWLNYSARPCASPFGLTLNGRVREKLFQTIFSSSATIFLFFISTFLRGNAYVSALDISI